MTWVQACTLTLSKLCKFISQLRCRNVCRWPAAGFVVAIVAPTLQGDTRRRRERANTFIQCKSNIRQILSSVWCLLLFCLVAAANCSLAYLDALTRQNLHHNILLCQLGHTSIHEYCWDKLTQHQSSLLPSQARTPFTTFLPFLLHSLISMQVLQDSICIIHHL